MRKRAINFFRRNAANYNGAQAILKGYQKELFISEELISVFKDLGQGRTPNGVCGALYAANLLLEEAGLKPITKEFQERVGSLYCSEIKGANFTCCESCIEIADELIEKSLAEKRK